MVISWFRYKFRLITILMVFASFNLFAYEQAYIKLPREIRSDKAVAQLINENNNKVQVLYFFSYGCHACAKFDPSFQDWARKQQDKNLVIYKLPVSFKKDWENLAKLYYIAQTLDPKVNFNSKIFTAIYDNNIDLSQISEMQKFFVKNGYKATDFDKTSNLPIISAKVKKADQLAKDYEVYQTPTIIVNGLVDSYQVDLTEDVKSFFTNLNELIANQNKIRLRTN